LTAPALDPLQQLRDLHLPAEPPWFPPPPGWWLLAALAVALVALLAHGLWRRRQRRAPYRQARRELERARTADGAARTYADEANRILKRVAIHALHRSDAAPLSGEPWLTFLDSLGTSSDFAHGPGRALGEARFGPDPAADVAALHACLARLLADLERRA
jgi:hypothetical protein